MRGNATAPLAPSCGLHAHGDPPRSPLAAGSCSALGPARHLIATTVLRDPRAIGRLSAAWMRDLALIRILLTTRECPHRESVQHRQRLVEFHSVCAGTRYENLQVAHGAAMLTRPAHLTPADGEIWKGRVSSSTIMCAQICGRPPGSRSAVSYATKRPLAAGEFPRAGSKSESRCSLWSTTLDAVSLLIGRTGIHADFLPDP